MFYTTHTFYLLEIYFFLIYSHKISIEFLFNLGCHNLTLVGNGLCEDETNTLECNFDDGDCCGSNITTSHCTECQCLEVIIPPSGTFFFFKFDTDTTLTFNVFENRLRDSSMDW
jgi:hypothetical protein